MVSKIKSLLSDVRVYWNMPAVGRYMTFKEIAAYSGGGIGAYMIITLGTACLLATNNTLLSSTLGIDPTDMYVMYVIAVLANIPLTGIRANIIDNTRNKAGKYRPYIVTMAIPAALICNLMVWFPYNKLPDIVGEGMLFGETRAYIAKCAIIMVLNLLLHFVYYFFYDAYENLIHVLSPDSQERADVASVKSVVYSLAPTLVNLFTPLIAEHIFHSNMTDIRVYRFLYPLLTVMGLLLCIVVYKNTEEKIVQAKTHVVQIKFFDALKAVAKNKYFWIISLASWIGFLESSYANIMYWMHTYGGACDGDVYSIVVTVYGNASLWGMLLAPFCIRKWGKKAVLIVTNLFNVVFILMMLPFVNEIHNLTIWLILGCLYLNAFMGSFAHILNPSIQADIRDYQQYKTGERIDGMFSAVTTIGTVITLLTSSVLPIIYERNGLTKENAAIVTSRPEILSRLLGDGKTTVGEMLAKQLAEGQDNYNNALSALYDPDILLSLVKVLIVVAAFGALLNVIPYIWYDFNERKQRSVVNVLKVRALFEDYANGVSKDADLVEGIDIIRYSRQMAAEAPKSISKKDYRNIKDKAAKKEAKKAYNEAVKFNENIEIAKFVCEELDKFSSDTGRFSLAESKKVYNAGLNGLLTANFSELKAALRAARNMPKSTAEEKEMRKFAIELVKKRIASCKSINKYFKNTEDLVQPDFKILEQYFDEEDNCNAELKKCYLCLKDAKKSKDKAEVTSLKSQIKNWKKQRDAAQKKAKQEMDKHAYFNRAAKPYIDSEKLIAQQENYTHFDEIAEQYETAKQRAEAVREQQIAEQKRLEEEKAAQKAAVKAKRKG
ncbi:MAG: MFS transporter [Clostridia bacterium]|nr:MFS transporter [Clostridia bacterium]